MNITVLSVGKIREKAFQLAIDEYSKRLSRYCRLTLLEVPDEKAPENISEAEQEQVKNREGEALLRYVKDGSYVIALAIKGKMLSSEEWAYKLSSLALAGNTNLVFVIGGSLGLSENVLARADFKLSFSPMTFPHQLMKVILLEQIYRGYRIMRGEPYHK